MGTKWVKVASVDEVTPGTIKGVVAEGERVALCNVEGELFAVHDECTHEQFPLSAGELDDTVLTCSLHGAQFDVETGEVIGLPATEDVKTYEIKLDGDDILIAIEES